MVLVSYAIKVAFQLKTQQATASLNSSYYANSSESTVNSKRMWNRLELACSAYIFYHSSAKFLRKYVVKMGRHYRV